MANWHSPLHSFALNELVSGGTMQAIQDSINALCPTGSYLFIHATPNASRAENLINGGWLECNGAAVSRGTYAALFAKIGTAFGPGDGSTTFNLPDLHGRTPYGAAGAAGNGDMTAFNASDGATLASRRPKHAHSVNSNHSHSDSGGSTSGAGNHTHNYSYPTFSTASGAASRLDGGGTATNTGNASNGNHAHSFSGGGMTNATTNVTAVGVSGMLDMSAYLVCCIVAVKT